MHIRFDPNTKAESVIEFSDFMKVDIRAGEIIEVLDFPEARKPAYKLKIYFGEGIGTKKSSAQITGRYAKEELLGKQVCAVVNFPSRQIGKFMSEVLVIGLGDEAGEISLISADHKVPNGARLL